MSQGRTGPVEVAAAVLERDGLVLVARRGKGKQLEGKWEFPGGKVREGETHRDCLRRELKEEFGVQVRVGEKLAASRCDYGFIEILLVAYRAECVSGTFRLTDHDELRWVAPHGLLGLDLAQADIPIAEEVVKRSKLP